MRFFDFGNADNMNELNWENIKTIAEFDGDVDGNGDGTPTSRYTDQRNISELTAGKPTTSQSLLIESLIQTLCDVFEDNRELSNQAYKAICEKLEKINLIDESYTVPEFDEMRSQFQMHIYKIIRAVGGHNIPHTLPTLSTSKTKPVETCWSRYHREFDELDFIAGGGFGKVFKARHKLDCIEYAVKQIKIHSKTIKLCHLAEVKTIASLNHPNIVQYKAAWLEPFVPDRNKLSMIQSENDLSDFDTVTTAHSSNSSSDPSDISMPEIRSTMDDDSFVIEFEHSNVEREETVWSSSTTKTCNQVICKYESNSVEESVCNQQQAILYIQMSLCQLTLRKWLNERNASCNMDEYYCGFFQKPNYSSHLDIVMDIFSQIVFGLNYIHTRNIIHHDIKPSNIFLEMDPDGRMIAQLGDFGLACPLQNEHRGIGIGTPLYAAPEQLSGECNSKSDIFSLGIVLIELLVPFGTDMERVRTIEQARKGTLPQMLNKKSANLLQSLLCHEQNRLTTKDLMEVIRKINLEQNILALRVSEDDHQIKDALIVDLLSQINALHETTEKTSLETQDLQKNMHEREQQIAELKTSLSEKDSQIALLKLQLQQYQNIPSSD